ncbi:MAG: Type 1 glutamine amidotransferase-like domain-containing protein [Candidatus Dormibacteria bacterium]
MSAEMTGALGLLGGNEMRPGCEPFDRALLDAAGSPSEVCIVPTAVVRNGSVPAALKLARAYFGSLGVKVVHVPLHRRSDASDGDVVRALRHSPLTYLLGGDPGYLLDTLRGTPAWAAVVAAFRGGAALAGSSAGSMVLAETLLLRSRNPGPAARHGRDALAMLPGTVVIPHLNAFGEGWLEAARREASGRDILGLDEATGLLWHDGWTAHGPGSVVLWRRGADPGLRRLEGMVLRWRRPGHAPSRRTTPPARVV